MKIGHSKSTNCVSYCFTRYGISSIKSIKAINKLVKIPIPVWWRQRKLWERKYCGDESWSAGPVVWQILLWLDHTQAARPKRTFFLKNKHFCFSRFYLAFKLLGWDPTKKLLYGAKFQTFNPNYRQQIPISNTGLHIPTCQMFVYFSRRSPFLILLLVCKPWRTGARL